MLCFNFAKLIPNLTSFAHCNYTENKITFNKRLMKFKLEICVDSVQSAIDAQAAGASRVELCADLAEGGTTPGFGTIKSARENVDIGLNVLIRPRAGDFLYTDLEFDIMNKDLDICRECGADGIVIGLLRADGKIDLERTARLVEMAHPMSVTFHRAFDMCSDPEQGLEDVIAAGAHRLLTSGQKNLAVDGMDLLKELVSRAGQRIIIMPGSGINEINIAEIAKKTGAGEFHLSARKVRESLMTFRKEGITMGNAPGYNEFSGKVADKEKIKKIIRILSDL
jgi:copper homeostasis protein